MKKNSAFQLRSGNKPSPAELLGVSPMKNDGKKAAKALGGSLTKIAEKLKEKKEKKEKKTSPAIPENVKEYLPFINPIGDNKTKTLPGPGEGLLPKPPTEAEKEFIGKFLK